MDGFEAGKEEGRFCHKELPDGSICQCRLDCHLHDWRQKDMFPEIRTATLKECIEIGEKFKQIRSAMMRDEALMQGGYNQALSDYQEQLKKLL